MRKYSFGNITKLYCKISMIGMLIGAVSFTTLAAAAQNCGYGYHRNAAGYCVRNAPGVYARPALAHPGCWRNAAGQLRCNPHKHCWRNMFGRVVCN